MKGSFLFAGEASGRRHRVLAKPEIGSATSKRRSGVPCLVIDKVMHVVSRQGAAFAALAAADAVLAVAGRNRERWLTKPLLMPVLVPGRSRAAQRALALSWVGDVALLGSGDAAFQAGLVSFLASHLAWIDALRKQPVRGRLGKHPALAIPPLAAGVAMNVLLWPRTGRDRVPVLLYSVALLAMSLAALDTDSPAAATGGLLFLASDALLALRKFGVVDLRSADGVVMATYAAAQALLAASTSSRGKTP
jgi:uncharacterized membrane protein YhhN